jgi:threonylcarbamoyladenosine tRNA methylthiotransferase MtaB
VKVAVLTLGCKANQAESFMIEAGLRAGGVEVVGLEEMPDYCVINTCSVTSKSDYQSRQIIRRAARAGSKVIVTGCYSELNKALVQSMDGVAEVVDSSKKDSISGKLSYHTSSYTLSRDSASRSRFFLKVQDGCNNSCSYCIIPAARGRSRSIPLQDVLEQINTVSGVYSEVVLTGIHLGTYGYDLCPKVSLADLVSAILLKTTLRRVRLSSIEIGEVTEQLLDLVADDRVCSHLHIPLQSGDDKILGLMNRRYTTRQFQDGISAIARRVPGIAIGTDVIIGFPGESKVEFENTLRFTEVLPLSYLHVFPFSGRPGTEAFRMPGAVDSATARGRCALLRAQGMRMKRAYMRDQIGRTVDALVEKAGPDSTIIGITANYLKVRASVDGCEPKDIVPVRIAHIDDDMLVGFGIR